jgi:diguanylate cyclase (GGDEF)-like protein/PAS domain S-box-containing protein
MDSLRLSSIFDTSTAALAVLGRDGRILEANPALCAIAGCAAEDLVGEEFWGFAAPGDTSLDHWPRLLSGELSTYDAERRYVAFDGREVVLNISLRPHLDATGTPAWFVVTVDDRTVQRAAEARSRSAETRFSSAFELAPIGMGLVSLDGRWLRVNQALCRITGYEAGELLEMRFQDITHTDDLEADLSLRQQLRDGRIPSFHMEKRYRAKDGAVVWVQISVSLVLDDEGEPSCFVTQVQDIRERKEVESNLAHRSMHDPLTGLPNRALLVEHLQQATQRRRIGDQTFAVLFVDVDGFKEVNDELGHTAGDEVLVAVAGRLSSALRASDTVARFGGDEFVVIAELAHARDAGLLADRLAEAVSEPIAVDGTGTVHVGASVGVAVHGGGQDDAETLLVRADVDMYRVKRSRKRAVAGLA